MNTQRRTVRKHAYSNILKFSPLKAESFQIKILIFFLISAQNIDCGYSLEPPRRGGSNEYPQSMFLSRNKKITYNPVNYNQYYYIVKDQNYIRMFSWCQLAQAELRLRGAHEETFHLWLYKMRPVKIRILIFAGRTCPKVRCPTFRLIYFFFSVPGTEQ